MTEMLDEADVDALVTRLRAELDLTAQGSTDRPLWEPARIEAGRLAPVSGDRDFYRRPGALGTLRYYATAAPKTVMRKLVRWYVEPIAAEQRAFNGAVLRLIDDVTAWTSSRLHAATERTDALSERLDRLERDVAARAGGENRLEDRLLRLERRPAGTAAARGCARRRPGRRAVRLLRLRGPHAREPRRDPPPPGRRTSTTSATRRRCSTSAAAAASSSASCATPGIEARGVDADADMAAFCRGEGLDVEHADALAYLEATAESSLGGVFAAHVVEHLPPPVLVRFLDLAATRLRPGGVLVLETPNPVSLVALKHYFADLTHAQPLVPETLAFLVRQAGLDVEETRYLNEPPAGERMRAGRAARRRALRGRPGGARRGRPPPERGRVRAAGLRGRRAATERMRIAVCLPQVPYQFGGAEILARELAESLRGRGHETELVSVPFKWYPNERVMTEPLLWRLLDLTEANGEPIDLVIGTKFPSYAVKHPNKVVWLVHQFRQAYELDGTELGQFGSSPRGPRDRARGAAARPARARRGSAAVRHLAERGASAARPRPGSTRRCCCRRRSRCPTATTATATSCSPSAGSTAPSASTCCSRPPPPSDLPVVVAGDGPDRRRLEELAERLGLNGRVTFAGRVSEEELADLYATCLAVYYAPVDEDFGMVPYEAFLAEKPVLTTHDAGGPLDAVTDRETGRRRRARAARARRRDGLARRAPRRGAGVGDARQGARRRAHVGPRRRPAARVKVDYLSPLPPEASGVADYSALLLPALERELDVEVVRPGAPPALARRPRDLPHRQQPRGARVDLRGAARAARARRPARVRRPPPRRGRDGRARRRARLPRRDAARGGRRRAAARARRHRRAGAAALGAPRRRLPARRARCSRGRSASSSTPSTSSSTCARPATAGRSSGSRIPRGRRPRSSRTGPTAPGA